MIDGLKLTFTGEDLRRLLLERADEHRQKASRWKRASEAREKQSEETLQLPEQVCEYEADRHAWPAAVLGFLSEHLEQAEVYRLDESDLEFGDLLPRKPDALEQEEYEARHGIERLGPYAKRLSYSPEIIEVTNPDAGRATSPAASAP